MDGGRRCCSAVVGRCALLLPVIGAAVLGGCSSEARSRVMHFFFEYPERVPGAGGAAAEPGSPAEEQAAAGETPSVRAGVPSRFVSRHPPFVERSCRSCHVRGSGQAPRPDFIAACRKCHPALYAYRRFGHAPAVSQDCRFCHVMHVSHQEALLKAPQRDLCTRCHAAQQNPDALNSYHKGIEGSRCTACHDPHWADNPSLLKAAAARQAGRGAPGSAAGEAPGVKTHP